MAARSLEIADSFTHVRSRMLRRVLQAEPLHLKSADLRQAVDRTLDALGRDVIDDAIPQTALHDRINAARDARTALTKNHNANCLRALCRFWSL